MKTLPSLEKMGELWSTNQKVIGAHVLDLDLDNNRQSPDRYFGVECARLRGHDVADRWLLKDDTEANEVMESGNEFHSVIVLSAKDF